MPTDKTLKTFNVFPDVETYEENIASLGDDELSLIPVHYVPVSGSAGTLTTTETIATASTVNASSARSMSLANGGSLTVSNGASGQAWITVVALAGTATISLGSNWSWSGSSPDLAKGLVTLAWYGTFGVANFTKYGE